MPVVRVKSDCTYGAGGKIPGGTVIEVTEAELAAFSDKFEKAEKPVVVTDAAASLAESNDIDLALVPGTGVDGKVTVDDVKGFLKSLEE